MNWEHLKTYVWVRWRLSANQVRRAGLFGAIIAAILATARILGGAVAFVAGLLVGLLALNHAEPWVVLAVWDGFVAVFLFLWLIGLVSELQRTELLSLNNFMHLPVSPAGAFLINYVGSSIGLSLILFLPAMIGLGAGLSLSRGPAMLVTFPLIAAFFLMVTAVTYQFRGWLAGMMANPRRRRAVVAVVTLLFLLVFQIPNIVTNLSPGARARREAMRESSRRLAALEEERAAGRISREEYEKRLLAGRAAWEAERGRENARDREILRTVSRIVPPGWLPTGAAAAVRGQLLPALAGFAGMSLIGIVSLWCSYRTTIRLYTGHLGSRRPRRKPAAKSAPQSTVTTAGEARGRPAFLEKRIPWIPEHAAAISLMSFRALVRAPEVKMLLLTPVIMVVVFGGMASGGKGDVALLARPLYALGLAAAVLIFGLTGFVGNQFAFDRAGFRAFVLSCASRRDILLGKNLAMLPVALLLMALVIAVSQWMHPMRPDHLAAVLLQTIPMYFLFCLAANLLSILAPIALKTGSGQPAPHQGTRVLFQIALMLVLPVLIGFTLIPLGIEALLAFMRWAAWFPAFLFFGLLQAAAVLWLYGVALQWQGGLLERREKKILEVVCSKVE